MSLPNTKVLVTYLDFFYQQEVEKGKLCLPTTTNHLTETLDLNGSDHYPHQMIQLPKDWGGSLLKHTPIKTNKVTDKRTCSKVPRAMWGDELTLENQNASSKTHMGSSQPQEGCSFIRGIWFWNWLMSVEYLVHWHSDGRQGCSVEQDHVLLLPLFYLNRSVVIGRPSVLAWIS